MGILDDIDSAAYDLERGRLGELTPVARNFTIVRDIPITGSNFLSALVGRIDWDALYKACNAENAPKLVGVSQFTY